MNPPETAAEAAVRPGWFGGLGKDAWRTLFGSNLGWLFDGFETYAVILTVIPAMQTLLPRTELARVPFYQGLTIAGMLLGWAFGGAIWGIFTDYIGRKRAMMYSMAVYAVFTGLTALAHNPDQFIAFRFLTGLGLGAEWGTGTTLLSEEWPAYARAKGVALLQSGFNVGFLLASLIWFALVGTGAQAWRWMFVIGAVPALLSIWYVRANVPESDAWSGVAEDRRRALAKRRQGQSLTAEERHLTRFTLSDVFADSNLRRVTIVGLGLSLIANVCWWAVSTWIPPYAVIVATHLHAPAPAHYGAVAGIYFDVGAIVGMWLLAIVADAWGRRWAVVIWSLLSCTLTEAVFLSHVPMSSLMVLGLINGVFTSGFFAIFPIMLPELYPTRVRGTAVAFVFNAARFVAFLGPLVGGLLIVRFHGIPHVASVIGFFYLAAALLIFLMPETRGKPLPQ